MCDIVILMLLARRLGDKCRSAGLKPLKYQLLLIGCWIGGEILGLVVGVGLMAAIAALLGPDGEAFSWLALLASVISCIALVAQIPFRNVHRLKMRQLDAEFCWTCSQCGEEVNRKAASCPMCGAVRPPNPRFAGLVDSSGPPADSSSDFRFLEPE